MARRFQVEDREDFGYNVTDTTSGQTQRIWFDYRGTAGNSATTWDFAPIDEAMEVEPQQMEQFRLRIHQDDNFAEEQFKWNRRERLWHQQMTTAGTASTQSGLWTASGTATDTDGTRFWMTSDVGRFARGISWIDIHCPILHKVTRPIEKLSRWLKLNRTAEEIQTELAEKQGDKLLREWLSKEEYDSLMKLGEMEIYNDDEIYIVKKSPGATVKVKKDGKEVGDFCLITKNMGFCSGDVLLTKIMMLKTDPENFKKVAIKR